MEIVFVRHGESTGNALKDEEAVYTGQWDCDLTERGYQQANALRGNPVFDGAEAFIVSDMKRTVATARCLTDRELITDPRIRERSLGEFEGRRILEIRRDPEYHKYFNDPEFTSFRQSFTVNAPGGENYSDVCKRVHPFLEDLKKSKYQKAVIVSHFCVIRCLLKEMLGLTEEETLQLKVPNCCPIRVNWDAGTFQKEEFFDITDDNGIPTGKTVTRSEAHAKGIPHRTAHIWIVKRAGTSFQVLLQKRSAQKDSFPSMYDTSSAGHIQAGDEPLPSAQRELFEELGVKAEKEDLTFAGTFHISYAMPFHGKMFRDNEIAFVYVYEKPVEAESLVLQTEEVEEVKWFDVEEVIRGCRHTDGTFCVPTEGLEIVCRYMEDRGSKVLKSDDRS